MREKRGRERGEFYRGKVFSNGGLTLELSRAKKEKRKKKKKIQNIDLFVYLCELLLLSAYTCFFL